MKVAFGSDFHLEFYDEIKMFRIIRGWEFKRGTDLIIIAGDLHVGAKNVIDALEFISKFHSMRVLYVPGNHEYYDSGFQPENMIFLNHGLNHDRYNIMLSDTIVLNGVMFAGCYGNLDGSWETINPWKHGALNDFHVISDFNERTERGQFERLQLIKDLTLSECDSKVVITHTMPSPKCISQQYRGSYLNPCFANDWEDVIVEHKPKFWVCGHTHDGGVVKIDETNVLINPHGYPKENPNWKWRYFNV